MIELRRRFKRPLRRDSKLKGGHAKSWTDVKYDWGLTAQQAEIDELADMLATC
ncbi:hypothetical protein ACIBKY_38500 [Nonomuraea sp. NPDC050394]|uniref:hypothetical protein n=1 Tax=Nonomuraea sp. NPDC050394 TaxID=3364363 RepID=UPI00379B9CCF